MIRLAAVPKWVDGPMRLTSKECESEGGADMRRIIGFAFSALLLGGCAAYVAPVPPPAPPVAGVYVAPPPLVVVPGPPLWWGWHGGWHRHRG